MTEGQENRKKGIRNDRKTEKRNDKRTEREIEGMTKRQNDRKTNSQCLTSKHQINTSQQKHIHL